MGADYATNFVGAVSGCVLRALTSACMLKNGRNDASYGVLAIKIGRVPFRRYQKKSECELKKHQTKEWPREKAACGLFFGAGIEVSRVHA